MYWSSPVRSTLNTGYITGVDMCKVCTEAVQSVALWTRVTLQVYRERDILHSTKKNGLFSGETSLLVFNLGWCWRPRCIAYYMWKHNEHLNQTNGYPGIEELQWQYPFWGYTLSSLFQWVNATTNAGISTASYGGIGSDGLKKCV